MDIINLLKEIIMPLWSIFYIFIFLHVVCTQNSSRTIGQDARREEDIKERVRAPPSPFEIRYDHEEKENLSGDEEYGESTLERNIENMQNDFR